MKPIEPTERSGPHESGEASVDAGRVTTVGQPRLNRRLTFYVLRFTLQRFILPFTLLFTTNAQDAGDPTATFFMGRIKYSQNDGNDCGTVGQELMRLISRASTLKIQTEKRIRLVDPELFETPFVFMNGHNNFVLSDEELGVLRKYLSKGGFYFASGCCTNPDFPKALRREFGRLFPNEPVKPLPYDHPIYRSFHIITGIRCLHEARDIHLEGLFHNGNLVMVLCEDGLCCSFSMANKCNDGKGVGPEDGQKLALNIAIYALTH